MNRRRLPNCRLAASVLRSAIWLWRRLGRLATPRQAGYGSQSIFLVISVAELYFSLPALALVSRLVPERSRSLVVGAWLMTNFSDNLFAGWLGGLWSGLPHSAFFLLITAIAAAAGGVMEATRRPLNAIFAGLSDSLGAYAQSGGLALLRVSKRTLSRLALRDPYANVTLSISILYATLRHTFASSRSREFANVVVLST